MTFQYSQAHLDFLTEACLTLSRKGVTEAFNERFNIDLSVGKIRHIMDTNNIRNGKTPFAAVYTDEHITFFEKYYPLESREKLTARFNAEFDQDKTVDQIAGVLKRHKIKSGRNGGGTGCHKNQFQKGMTAHNKKPIGSERTRKTGYTEIKVAEPDVWESKQRLIWAEHFGPIPDGHMVGFKDSDSANFDPDNLFIVSNAEHQRLNLANFKEAWPEHKDTIILIAKVDSKSAELMRTI